MYLREMGGVELLSREGEIAIAKRIEAGKKVMLNALAQSPIMAKKIFQWHESLEKGEILVREIIDFILFVHPKDSILFFLLPVCIISCNFFIDYAPKKT